jgi:hypothetical protein
MPTIELTNVDIALYALYKLGGDTAPIHTEDVALKCFQLVPERFSWKKYPKYPELDPARFALLDAAKSVYGKLARQVFKKIAGKRQSHWVLTSTGLDYVRPRLEVLNQLESGQIVVVSEHREEDRFIGQVKKHVTFKKFSVTGTCEGIEKYEFTDLLHCSLDASPKILRERLERLRNRAEKAGAEQVKRFLASCERHFGNMLGG